jgi:uncharacterized protein YhdP
MHDVRLKATGTKAWRVDVASREIDGRIDWRPEAADSQGNGQLSARLTRLDLGTAEHVDSGAASARASQAAEVDTADPTKWPSIELSADELISGGHALGRLELRGRPRGADWRVERLRVTSPEGDIDVEGWWRGGPPQRTDVDVTLAVKDTPAFLRRHGYPDAVRGAPTRITGKLSWPGGLHRFDFVTLDGSISIDTKAGQFTRMEPGLAKLLGVLNLQALPRRLTLDFRDVFSEGFAFDALAGTVRIAGGMMSTTDLRFAGPSARVEISGEANLVEETQKLDVKVLPSLATSVAVGAAVGLANPAIGAAVLLGQKLLQDPVDRLFATHYRVTGSWSDPQVARVALARDPRAAEHTR